MVNFKFWQSAPKEPAPPVQKVEEVIESKDAVRTVTKIAFIPPVKSPGLPFLKRTEYWNESDFLPPEYDLSEMSVIEDSISGERVTAVKIDGLLKTLTFKELWDEIAKECQLFTKNGQDYLYPENLEILSGELTQKEVLPYGRKFKTKTKSEINGVWKKCSYLTRHLTSKEGFLFLQKFGFTEVTKDHSLITLNSNQLEKFKPEEKKKLVTISSIPSEFGKINKIDLGPFTSYELRENEIYYKGTQKRYTNKICRYIDQEHLYDFVALLGAYISEGSVKRIKSGRYIDLRISSTNLSWLEDLQAKFENIFPDKNTRIVLASKSKTSLTYALICNKQIVADLFANLCGYKSEFKRMPDFIYLLKKDIVEYFRNYMLDGDGHRETYGDSYTSKSIKLISQYSLLLRFLNINHTFNYRFNHNRIYYAVRTNNFKVKNSYKTWLIKRDFMNEYVYDLEVEDTHNFVDLCGQILLHNTESFLRQALKKKTALAFKNGWDLVGKNKSIVDYIRRRFLQIEQASEIPLDVLLRETFHCFIRDHNAFLVKVRDSDRSGGDPRKGFRKRSFLDPIAAYFPLHPATMRPKIDTKGSIVKWRQKLPDGRFKDYPKKNIIHFYFDRPPGFIFGKPILIPVIDDILALRRIEEHIETLIYKHIFPIFQYIVGTETHPAEIYPDGTTEVDKVKYQLQNMPPEGSFVMPERHKIEPIAIGNNVLDASQYLEHFKKRVFSGIGVSSVDMGETDTSNKSTAENSSRALIDDTKDYQLSFASFINLYIIRELLLESPWVQNPKVDVLAPENNVYFTFREIDLEAMLKKQNHMMALYQGHAISENEMRENNGYDIIQDSQRENMFLELVTAKISEMDSEAKMDQARVSASIKAKQQPSNQHGKRSGPRLTKPDFLSVKFIGDQKDFSKIVKDNYIFNKFIKNLRLELKKDSDYLKFSYKNTQVLDFQRNQDYISLKEQQLHAQIEDSITNFHKLISRAIVKTSNKQELYTFTEGCLLILRTDIANAFNDFFVKNFNTESLYD